VIRQQGQRKAGASSKSIARQAGAARISTTKVVKVVAAIARAERASLLINFREDPKIYAHIH
jgi:hypothetical protein